MPAEGIRQIGLAYVVAVTPDVCLTPMGATPVPVPYPIVGFFDNVVIVATTVRMRGRPTFTTASQVTTVMGDEAGTAGGVKSGVNKSICEAITASSTVRAEGNRILRHGDQMKMNNGNTIGTVIFMPGLGPTIVGAPSEDDDPVGMLLQRAAKNNKGGTLNLLKDTAGELKDMAVGFAKSSEHQVDYLRRLKNGDFAGVGKDFFFETMQRDNPYNAIKPYIDAARSDDPDALGAKVATQLLLALVMDGMGGEASAGAEADAGAADAADTLVDGADADAADTLVDGADADAADTSEMDTAPGPEATEAGDGLTVTGAATASSIDVLEIMLNEFSEATQALVKLSPTLSEQLAQLLADSWRVVKGQAGKGSFADRAAKNIVIGDGAAINEVGALGHEAGHAINPAPPTLPTSGLSEAEYVRQDVANRMADEGRAQFNEAKVRDEIGGDDVEGNKMSGQKSDQYQDIYDQYDDGNGNMSQEEAENQMGQAMKDDTTSTTGDKYRDYYADHAMRRYNGE